ncbi:MAG: NADH:ubiquinone reductase (Na(+)-transporting) subunit C [Bacteroidota bacterium]|nr:NADH:ubiquinone reductase (Na(+)-transporting) subunit C [Bacteroidota bacterium]
MDVNKNTYTFVFASILVIVLAAVLSFLSVKLSPKQEANIVKEKKQNILKSVGIHTSRDTADFLYNQYIKEEIVLDHNGNIMTGKAFEINLKLEMKKDLKDQNLPIFLASIENDRECYIIPLRGKGLWGPIWGYIALENDFKTVFGAVFDHKSETPGLGAEINTREFQDPFQNKLIFKDKDFVSIKVVKGGAKSGDDHGVDAISGGTITSDGVTEMLYERLERYLPYFTRMINAQKEENNDTLSLQLDSIQI